MSDQYRGTGGDLFDYIRLVCRAESHADRTVKVAEFARRQDDAPSREVLEIHQSSGDVLYEDGPDRWILEYGHLSSGRAKPDDDISSVRSLTDQEHPELRPEDRWALKCRLCGLKVTVREDTLGPMLSKLRGNGESEVPLTVLAAILSK